MFLLPARLRAIACLLPLLALASLGPGCHSGNGGGGVVDQDPLTPGTVDIEMIGSRTQSTILFEDHEFVSTDCAVIEGWVAQAGIRRLLRFDTLVANMGAIDLVMGDPANPTPPFTAADFENNACYGDYFFRDFAGFELRDGTGASVGFGHKLACCVLDSLPIVSTQSHGYTCDHQGLSPGWADLYPSYLEGQWVDVTGVPEGDYFLTVTANPNRTIPEANNVRPNSATIPVHVPDPNAPL